MTKSDIQELRDKKNEYSKEYYKQNKAKRLEYQHKYYWSHREERLLYRKRHSKEYYRRNKIHYCEYQRAYYQKHKKRILKNAKKYREKLKRLYYEWNEQRRAEEELARFTPEEKKQYDLWEIEWNKKFKETQKHTVY